MTIQHKVTHVATKYTNYWMSFGIFVVLCCSYILSSPGRIESIDGQIRYEIARNLLREGRPIIRDAAIQAFGHRRYQSKDVYSLYGPAASVSSLPLLLLGQMIVDDRQEWSRFLFTLTTPVYGGLIGVVLFLYIVSLGFSLRVALFWTMIVGYGTMIWPLSTSVLDQVQHAFWLLLAAYWGYLSQKKQSLLLALCAGFAAGVLFLYQEYYGILLPFIALVTISFQKNEPNWQSSLLRYCLFGLASSFGLCVCMLYNWSRFGFLLRTISAYQLESGLKGIHPSSSGEFIVGAASLLFSPGKSIFLYSPLLILCFWGIKKLMKQHRGLFWAIISVSVVQVCVISSVSYFGGDWCWGPRYLVVLLPLWALMLPFLLLDIEQKIKFWMQAIIAVSVFIQILAIQVDHQRFFYNNSVSQFFWAEDPWFYFKKSALLERFSEIKFVWLKQLPKKIKFFAPTPYQYKTYTPFGPPSHLTGKHWLRYFEVFSLPRPWPLWMGMYRKGPPPFPFSYIYPFVFVFFFLLFGVWILWYVMSLHIQEEGCP